MILCKADPSLKDYFQNKEHFADFMNAIQFHGKDLISSHDLSIVDTDMSTLIEGNKVDMTFNRNRDIMIRSCHDGIYALQAIENQKAIDYDMPIRVLMYDVLCYNQQLRAYHRRDQKDGFRLEPIITLVVYYGEKIWKGPKRLLDMMKIPNELQGMINDWDAHVVDIKDVDVKLFKNSDNESFVKGIQMFYEWTGEGKLLEMKVSKDIGLLIATVVDNQDFMKVIEEEKGDEIEMCTSLDIFAQKNKMLGKYEGRVLTLVQILKKKFNSLPDDIVIQIENSNEEQLDLITNHILEIKDENDIFKLLNQEK